MYLEGDIETLDFDNKSEKKNEIRPAASSS